MNSQFIDWLENKSSRTDKKGSIETENSGFDKNEKFLNIRVYIDKIESRDEKN